VAWDTYSIPTPSRSPTPVNHPVREPLRTTPLSLPTRPWRQRWRRTLLRTRASGDRLVGQVGQVETAIVVLGVLRRGTRGQGRAGGRAHRDTRETGRRCGILAVLTPLLYVVWFLPAWLGIADPEEGWGPALFGLAITPAIFAAHFIADAFRRRNLAKEKNR
jgi:hypothetical protein